MPALDNQLESATISFNWLFQLCPSLGFFIRKSPISKPNFIEEVLVNKKKTYLTVAGVKKLKKELEQLKEEKRPNLVKRVARARDYGDLSENSEYSNAREELDFTDQRIEELEETLKKAEVIKKQKDTDDSADIGETITIKTNGKTKTYTLVGEMEADPTENKISISSPIGKALLGKKEGEKVKIETPGGEVEYTIVNIK